MGKTKELFTIITPLVCGGLLCALAVGALTPVCFVSAAAMGAAQLGVLGIVTATFEVVRNLVRTQRANTAA